MSFFSQGSAIPGVRDASAAAAGLIGEYLEATLLGGSATSVANGTAKTIVSLALTPGDWDLSGTLVYLPANTTIGLTAEGSFSETTNTRSFEPGDVNRQMLGNASGYTFGAGEFLSLPMPVKRVSTASNKTIYLVALAQFTTSTMTAYGRLQARRVR